MHLRIRQEPDALREFGSLTAVAWDAEGITRKALAETLADAMADERESVPAGGSERFTPRSGTVKELVRAVMVDGITDPAVVLAEVRADEPDASGLSARLAVSQPPGSDAGVAAARLHAVSLGVAREAQRARVDPPPTSGLRLYADERAGG
ncbi:hypothetical protein N4G69_24435 [Streptomyces mirabilis]|uniref:hypothetical protein n=1 Tax=Streptomyces mirabilis TaxID=68239 RepID=UPI0021BF18CC|nr:hypothetical protein [Streptomyces mirabilis]MCT9108730.1 hypothetical protein [Streptomyces mirabilis]